MKPVRPTKTVLPTKPSPNVSNSANVTPLRPIGQTSTNNKPNNYTQYSDRSNSRIVKKPQNVVKQNICFHVGRFSLTSGYNAGRIDPSTATIVDDEYCKATDTHYKCRYPTLFTMPTCMNIVLEPRFAKIIPTFWSLQYTAPYTLFINTFSENYDNLRYEIVTNYNKKIESVTPKLTINDKSKSFSQRLQNFSKVSQTIAKDSSPTIINKLAFTNTQRNLISNCNLFMEFFKFVNDFKVKIYKASPYYDNKFVNKLPSSELTFSQIQVPNEILCGVYMTGDRKSFDICELTPVDTSGKIEYKTKPVKNYSYDENKPLFVQAENKLTTLFTQFETVHEIINDIKSDLYIYEMVNVLLSNELSTEDDKIKITSILKDYDSFWEKVSEKINKKKKSIKNLIKNQILTENKDYITSNRVLDLVIPFTDNTINYTVNGEAPAQISILLAIQELYKRLMNNYKPQLLKLIDLFIGELSPTNESMKVIQEFLGKCSITDYSWKEKTPTKAIININELLNVIVDIVKPDVKIHYNGLYKIKYSENVSTGLITQGTSYIRSYYPWCERDYAAAALNVGISGTKGLVKGTAVATGVATAIGLGTVGAVGLGTAYVGEKAYHRYLDAKARLNGEKHSMGGSTRKTHRSKGNRTRKYKHVHKETRNTVKNSFRFASGVRISSRERSSKEIEKRHANKQNTRKTRKH